MNYFDEFYYTSKYYIASNSTFEISTIQYYSYEVELNAIVFEGSNNDESRWVNGTLIDEGDYIRVQNAANKINLAIVIVGSRANGTAHSNSDWDYIIRGLNNKKWKKIKNSLPGAKSIDCPFRRIDIMHTPLDETKPYIKISPHESGYNHPIE